MSEAQAGERERSTNPLKGASLRIGEMCADMFGCVLGEATLQRARQEQHQALEPFENRLAANTASRFSNISASPWTDALSCLSLQKAPE